MKRSLFVSLAIVALLLTTALPGQAERGFHGGGGGHGWGWGPAVGLGFGLGLLGLSYPWYGNPYYPSYAPAPVIEQPPTEMYVQPEPQQTREPDYWYYCRDPEGYYPYVKQCPDGWMRVVPTPPRQ